MARIDNGLPSRTNSCTNPSAETDTTGWAGSGGTLTNPTAAGGYGEKVFRVTSTGAVGFGMTTTSAAQAAITAGQSLTVSTLVTKLPAGRKSRVRINWYDAESGYLSTSVGSLSDVLDRRSITAVAPANAAFARPDTFTDGGAVGEVYEVDGWLFEKSATLAPYLPTPTQLASGEAVENEDGTFTLTPFNRSGFATGSSACIVNPPA